MSSIQALMGNNLDTQSQQEQMAEALRGQQRAGDYLSLSTIAPLAQMGQRVNKGADISAASVGGLNKARLLADAKLSAADTLNQNKVVAASALAKSKLAQAKGKGKGNDFKKFRDSASEPFTHSETGEVAYLYNNPNEGERGYYNSRGEPVDIRDYTATQYLSGKERDGFLESAEGIRGFQRFAQTLPEQATMKDSDWFGQPTVRTKLGQLFPSAQESDWISPEGAGFWKDKRRFSDMIIKNEMFGSALTEAEIRTWVENNISPENTFAQSMGALKDLQFYAQEKRMQGLDSSQARGVSSRELAPLRESEENQAKYRTNAALRKNGAFGTSYYELRKLARAENMTMDELLKVLEEESNLAGGS